MIARRELPRKFREWNAKWSAPFGRSGPRFTGRLRKALTHIEGLSVWSEARLRGPFGWQGNNSTRVFEYPWAYHSVREIGRELRILDVGGGLGGLQFVLAREGNLVVNVEPGQDSLGWQYRSDLHGRLCRAYHAPVQLFPRKIDLLDAPPQSFDVLLSISALEHFPDNDLTAVARAAQRLLKPDGRVVITLDLFLDLKPFSEREKNEWGRNLNVREFLCACGLRLKEGNPTELYGFPEFSPARIMSNLGTYLLGESYPALSQCFVAYPDRRA